MNRQLNRKIVRVWVDEDGCMFHEACTGIPEVLAMRDRYYPEVTANAEEFFETKRKDIIDTVFSCPSASLYIEFDDGTVVSSDDFGKIDP